MRNALPIFARWLHTVALSLWLGGLVAIGAFVAPTAFRVVRANPAFAGHPDLQALIAGGIVGGSLRVFNIVCYVCASLLLLANGLLWHSLSRAGRTWTLLAMLLTLLLLGTALYQGFSLFPALDTAQAQGNTPLFDALHARYEHLSINVQFPLLLLLALIAASRDSVRVVGPVASPVPSKS